MKENDLRQTQGRQQATAAEDRYQRQLLLEELGREGQAKIRRAKVLLVGVGGLGSPIATYLAGAGIGTLGLIDDDVVSVTNLHRQVLYSEEEVGLPKAECAKRRLHALNHEVNIVAYPERLTHENAETLISQYDLVVDGMDNFATRFIVSDACERLAKPYVHGAIRGLEGQVSVLCCPAACSPNGETGRCTYRTLFPDEAATLAMPHPGKQVLGTTPAIVGSVEATQALMLIAGFGSPLIDKLWTIHLATMQCFTIQLQ